MKIHKCVGFHKLLLASVSVLVGTINKKKSYLL